MTAFNVVRFRVKPGHEAEFIEAQKKSREDLAGSKRLTMIKTGDRSYCIIGEWDSMQNLIGRAAENDRQARHVPQHAGRPGWRARRDRSRIWRGHPR